MGLPSCSVPHSSPVKILTGLLCVHMALIQVSALRRTRCWMLDTGYWIKEGIIFSYLSSIASPARIPPIAGGAWNFVRCMSAVSSIRHPASSFIRYPASRIQYHFAKHSTAYCYRITKQKRKFLYSQDNTGLFF